jgi:hypothetical protein
VAGSIPLMRNTILMEKKVFDPPASDIYSILTKDTVAFEFTIKRLFCTKVLFVTHENTER